MPGPKAEFRYTPSTRIDPLVNAVLDTDLFGAPDLIGAGDVRRTRAHRGVPPVASAVPKLSNRQSNEFTERQHSAPGR